MDEILFELRDHSSGLNCGRWDYIFSFIKKFKNDPKFVLPDRSEIGMTTHFMDSYVKLLIQTCHKRGIHAMGGMAAQIPIKTDAEANKLAMDKVRKDKLREVKAGHDGTWVAHPDLVKIAKEVFETHLPFPNQIFIRREDVNISASDLISVQGIDQSKITEKGLRMNINVSLLYMESWLRGLGCVPIHNLMEDAATAEISRSQIWQWVRHQVFTTDGTRITAEHALEILEQETSLALKTAKSGNRFNEARSFLASTIQGKEYAEFLTTLCYDFIVAKPSKL